MKKTQKILTKRKISITIALIVLALFMAGCDLIDNQPARLSPPSWIHGTWEIKIDGNVIASLDFTSDNIVFQNQLAGVGLDYKELGNNVGVNITDDTVSDTVYKMTMKSDKESLVYTFTKESDDTLSMHQNANGIITELKDFIKK